ncbi:MAG: hypothetical protein EBR82_88270 [Caulobacteraceae bacterium]|nr:hypothetical protein [Caulobacteraceae bacterium]
MATSKQPIQWAWIEEQWQLGRLSNVAITKAHQEQFGSTVAESAIRKRASQFGWQRDLSDAIQKETRRKLAEGALPHEVRESASASANPKAVEDVLATVEAAADEAVKVTLEHRAHAKQLHALATQYAFHVAHSLKIRDDGTPVNTYEPGELKDIGTSLSAMANNRTRAIEIERKSYNLDAPPAQNTDGKFSGIEIVFTAGVVEDEPGNE